MTNDMISSGRRLLEELDREGLHPQAMFWEYNEECRQWFLQIVRKKMNTGDPRKILRRVFKTVDAMPEMAQQFGIDFFTVRGTWDAGYEASLDRMPYGSKGQGAPKREWFNRDFTAID